MSDEKPKRRLPVLPSSGGGADDDADDRPPWHWSAIGAAGVFVLWLPMAYIVNGAIARFGGASWIRVAANLAAFALASLGAGAIVGRFGARAGVKEAAVSGGAAAVIAWALAAWDAARSGYVVWALILAVLVAVGAGSAAAGGKIGAAKRPRSH